MIQRKIHIQQNLSKDLSFRELCDSKLAGFLSFNNMQGFPNSVKGWGGSEILLGEIFYQVVETGGGGNFPGGWMSTFLVGRGNPPHPPR